MLGCYKYFSYICGAFPSEKANDKATFLHYTYNSLSYKAMHDVCYVFKLH